MNGTLVAVCRSKEKGTQKKSINKAYLRESHGLDGDAHAGSRREVSLLALEDIEKFGKKFDVYIGYGDFGENLVTRGIDLGKIKIGAKIRIGESLLEITEIGKECHSGCSIYRKAGACIMPKRGVFAKVLKGGYVNAGDRMEVLERTENGHTIV